MILLKDTRPFGHGTHRAVYQHPGNPQRCLKIMTEDWRVCGRRQRAGWLSRTFRPRWYFHESESELRFSEVLRRRVGACAFQHLAEAHCLVATDLGEALEVDLITDHDGEISLSLKEYVWKFGLTPECREAIDAFWLGLDRHAIFAEGRPDNVSLSRKADGSCQCYAIDGYGLGQFIPIAKWLPSAKRKTFKKWRARQERYLEALLEKKRTGGHVGTDGFRL